MQPQLVALERAAQLALQHQALDGFRVHVARVVLEAVAAGLLGLVQRRVGVANQIDDVVAVARVNGEAHARREEDLLAVHLERLAGRRQQPRRELVQVPLHGVEPLEAGDQHRELVAGQPAGVRILAELGEHAAREDLEARVAGRVAERVVDVFETVDVEVHDRDVLLAAARPGDRLLQQMLKLHAVGDLGQRVRAGEIADPLLDALALVDVVRRVHLALERVAVVQHVRHGVGDADGRAVGAQHRAFARPRRDAFGAPAIVRQDQLVRDLADQRRFVLAEELDGSGVGALDLAFRVGDEQRFAHARQQAIEVIARDRARAQVRAHRVDGRRELAQLRRVAEGRGVDLAVRALQRSRDGA